MKKKKMLAVLLAAVFCFSGCSAAGSTGTQEGEKETAMAEKTEEEEKEEEQTEGEWQEISLPLKGPTEIKETDLAFGTFSGTDIVLPFQRFLNSFHLFMKDQEISKTLPVLKKKEDRKKVYYQALYSNGMTITMEQDREAKEDHFTKIELEIPEVKDSDDITLCVLYCYSAVLAGEPYGEKDEDLAAALMVKIMEAFQKEGDIQTIKHTKGSVYYRMLYRDNTLTFSLQPLVFVEGFGKVVPEGIFIETYNTMAAYLADAEIGAPSDFNADNGNIVQNYSYKDESGYFYLEKDADESQYSRLLFTYKETDDASKFRFFMRSVLLYMLCSPDVYVDLGELFYEASISSDGMAVVLEKGVWCFFMIEEDDMIFFVNSDSDI